MPHSKLVAAITESNLTSPYLTPKTKSKLTYKTQPDNQSWTTCSSSSASDERSSSSPALRYSRSDVARIASEIYARVVADTELALFTEWVVEKEENFAVAREFVRELGLDQGYSVLRVENPYMQQLLLDTLHLRPQ